MDWMSMSKLYSSLKEQINKDFVLDVLNGGDGLYTEILELFSINVS